MQIDALYGQKNDEKNALSEREAVALRQLEELRRDAVRLATELARVQGVCDKWEQATEACDRDYTIQMYRDNALLAWKRGVREAWEAHLRHGADDKTLHNLRVAIESEDAGVMPDAQRRAYLDQVERWGSEDAPGEPKEET